MSQTGTRWVARYDCTIDMSTYLQCRSPVKFLTLDLIDHRGAIDYIQLHQMTGMPTDYAAERLTRYARAGLLKRERDGRNGRSTFRLTARGRQRLGFFRRQ